ncbi:MAG: CRISPR-associated endonuclease Cas2 [Candidatus Micrarchaeota archaeon]|nr:CRISPR-associated endonuclease Cas2 [Candidatus Micrarchaeota archaeon]
MSFCILVYDMDSTDENYENNARRVRQISTRYLKRVQKSVFEGNITYSKLKQLEYEINSVIYNSQDKILIYVFDDNTSYDKIRINYKQEDEEFI